MQRRQFLKYLLPLGLATAGVAVGVTLFKKTACTVLDLPTLLKRLQPFADKELANKLDTQISASDLNRLQAAIGEKCDENFDERLRQLIAADFAEGKIQNVDGWILSETEALTHQLVYQSTQHAN